MLTSLGGYTVTETAQPTPTPMLEILGEKYYHDSQLARMGEKLNELNDVQREFDEFKKRVRDLALETAEEQNWCDEGFNKAMMTLGLEPKPLNYRVTIRVFAYQDVEVELQASNEEEAVARVLDSEDSQHLIWTETVAEGWEGSSIDMPGGEPYEIKCIQQL